MTESSTVVYQENFPDLRNKLMKRAKMVNKTNRVSFADRHKDVSQCFEMEDITDELMQSKFNNSRRTKSNF